MVLVKTECYRCKVEIELKKSDLKYRLRKNKSGKVFCSRICATKEQFKQSYINVNCFECNIEFTRRKGRIDQNKKRGSVGNFCSKKCAYIYRDKINTKYKEKYKEIICDYCGKEKTISIYNYNRAIKQNVGKKIYCSQDCSRRAPSLLHLIHNCMKFLGEKKYSTTIGIIPDAVFSKNDKLIAVESERTISIARVNKKIKAYDTIPNNYDEVHVFWIDPRNDDKISTHYHKKGGKWNEIPIENLNITV